MALADAGFGSHHTRGIGGLLTGRRILMGNFRSAGTAHRRLGQRHLHRSAHRPHLATRAQHPLPHAGAGRAGGRRRGARPHVLPGPQPAGAADGEPLRRVRPDLRRRAAARRRRAPGRRATARPSGCALQRKSVLDFLGQELAAVRTHVGADDRARIDAHLESVRDIERRLLVDAAAPARAPRPAAGCATARPGPADRRAGQREPARGRAACRWTCWRRPSPATWCGWRPCSGPTPRATRPSPSSGVTGQHHAMSHAGDGDAAAQESLTKINVFYAEQLALPAGPAGRHRERATGPCSTTRWCSGPSRWARATTTPTATCPSCWRGAAGGHFRTGRFVDYQARGRSQPHNNLLVSLANAMGLPDTSFGDPEHCTGPLPDLG